jgi:hypothetical protein
MEEHNNSDKMEIVETQEISETSQPQQSALNILSSSTSSSSSSVESGAGASVGVNHNTTEEVNSVTEAEATKKDQAVEGLIQQEAGTKSNGEVSAASSGSGSVDEQAGSKLPHTTTELNASDSFLAMQKSSDESASGIKQEPSVTNG